MAFWVWPLVIIQYLNRFSDFISKFLIFCIKIGLFPDLSFGLLDTELCLGFFIPATLLLYNAILQKLCKISEMAPIFTHIEVLVCTLVV